MITKRTFKSNSGKTLFFLFYEETDPLISQAEKYTF